MARIVAWINIPVGCGSLGRIAVIKGIERTARRLTSQPTEAELDQTLEDVKHNLSFFVHRMWFLMRRNRLLFWLCVVTFSVMLGATLALLTPLWSKRTTLYPGQQLSLENFKLHNRALSPQNFYYQVARPVNILVMGIEPDSRASNSSSKVFAGASDTMLLVRLDPIQNSLRVLSIPKDSQVVLPEIGLGKISLANSLGGPSLAARIVSRTLNNVPIDRYVRISTVALRELVDQLGGVEVFVPRRMLYKDATQQLEINLYPGWQTLNGQEALQFAQFRHSQAGDLERVQRQQSLLKALRDRFTSPTVLPRLPQVARIMQSFVDTNLSSEEILALTNFSVAIEPENLQMVMLPGDLSPFSQDSSSYWLYPPGQDQIMSKYFGVNINGVAQKPRSLTSLKIAVQNVSGIPNLSQQVVNYLKAKGFAKVYLVSDLPELQRRTEIIAQKGNLEAATELYKVLGLGNIEVSATGDIESHLTIRVGKDWDTNTPKESTDSNPYGWQWGKSKNSFKF